MVHHRLILPDTFDEFCKLRSGQSLREIKRHGRVISRELGEECELIEIRTPEELRQWQDDIDSITDRSWQGRLLGQQVDFMGVMEVAERGWLRSFFLMAGGRPLAFDLCYQGKEVLFREQSAYDPEFRKHYPGEYLFFRTVEYLYGHQKPEAIDFGIGEGYHKKEFANDSVDVDALWIVRNTVGRRLVFGLYGLSRMLDQFLRASLDCVGLKHRLVSRAKRSR